MRFVKIDVPKLGRRQMMFGAVCLLGFSVGKVSLEAKQLELPHFFAKSRTAKLPVPAAVKFSPLEISLQAFFRGKFPESSADEVVELTRLFLQLCRDYHFKPAQILGLIHVESAFRIEAESPVGALGLMQVMPATGREVAESLGMAWNGRATLVDPKSNLRLGFHYLAMLRRKFSNRADRYLTAYNWGPYRVAGMVEKRRPLPLDYFRKVQRFQRQYAPIDLQAGL